MKVDGGTAMVQVYSGAGHIGLVEQRDRNGRGRRSLGRVRRDIRDRQVRMNETCRSRAVKFHAA